MCVIKINLNATTPSGTSIVSANGKYRLTGSGPWTNFNISLNNPQTPNITYAGDYELSVTVTNNLGQTSNEALSTFSITNDCGKIIQQDCDIWALDMKVVSSNSYVIINYYDCYDNSLQIKQPAVGSVQLKFCAKRISSINLGTIVINGGTINNSTYDGSLGKLTKTTKKCGI